MSYATGDLKINSIKISSEKNVTIDFVANEANIIWRKVHKHADMDLIHRTHSEFCKAYPMVIRYMCEMNEYDPKAFRKWLMKIKERPWKTEEEYLDAQADYVSMLFRAKKPRAAQHEVNNVRKNIRAALQHEHTQFKFYAEKFDKEVNSAESTLREKNKEELYEFVRAAGEVGMAPAGTVRVESEIPPHCVDETPPAVQNSLSELVADLTSNELLG